MIRRATENDVNSILELYKEEFYAMSKLQPYFFKDGENDALFIKNMILKEDADILLFEDDGETIGFILIQEKRSPEFSFFVKHNYAYIMDIVVSEHKRGEGVGTVLIESAKKMGSKKKLGLYIS